MGNSKSDHSSRVMSSNQDVSEQRDTVLRRMIATPPQPKARPSRPPAPPKGEGDKPPE